MIEATNGVIPLSPAVHCRVEVDLSYAAQPDMLLRLHRAMLKTIRQSVADSPVLVSAECIHVYRLPHHDAGPDRLVYVGRWMPPDSAPCEMRGGPADGSTFTAPRDERGYPTENVMVPAPESSTVVAEYASAALAPLPQPYEYRLVGFRQDPAVWVYDVR